VENYFRTSGALVGDYWVAINRTDAASPFMYFNGTELGPNNSNASPFVHWSWYHFSFRGNAGWAQGSGPELAVPPASWPCWRPGHCSCGGTCAPVHWAQLCQGCAVPSHCLLCHCALSRHPLRRYDCVLAWGDLKYDSYFGDSSALQQGSTTYYQTTAGYLKNGWTAYPCTSSAFFVCQLDAPSLPCFPPPIPPSPPLNPPSPPSPPAPPNCAPTYNASFFCDGTASYCYSFIKTPANFSAASANCAAMNGWLVMYDSPLLQFDVESYLNISGALTPYYYWIGIRRDSINASYTYVRDNSSLPQGASNSPYAHWSWRQAVAAAQHGFDCVIAQGQFAYDIYMGDATARQLANVDYYATNDPIYVSLKFGWNAQKCNASYAYMCQVPTSLFPCYPPPSPTPPPPAPPPPPMPPTPPSGRAFAWLRGLPVGAAKGHPKRAA
jgi:hypothetical protein